MEYIELIKVYGKYRIVIKKPDREEKHPDETWQRLLTSKKRISSKHVISFFEEFIHNLTDEEKTNIKKERRYYRVGSFHFGL